MAILDLKNKLYDAIAKNSSDLSYGKEFNETVLQKNEGAYISTIKIEKGKYSQIKDFRIGFYKYKSDDKYKSTSPAAKRSSYLMPFKTQKKLHSISENTNRLISKRSYINWLFADDKEWLYVYNPEQLNLIIDESVADIVKQFNKFSSK